MTVKAAAGIVFLLLLLVPLSVILTFSLLPFWQLLEDASGLQIVGHASLAEWCFPVIYIVLLAVVGVIFRQLRAR